MKPALSAKLSDFGVNVYSLYVPDLMHEFELDVWKNTLTHLVRILHSMGGGKVQLFNERFVVPCQSFRIHSLILFHQVP